MWRSYRWNVIKTSKIRIVHKALAKRSSTIRVYVCAVSTVQCSLYIRFISSDDKRENWRKNGHRNNDDNDVDDDIITIIMIIKWSQVGYNLKKRVAAGISFIQSQNQVNAIGYERNAYKWCREKKTGAQLGTQWNWNEMCTIECQPIWREKKGAQTERTVCSDMNAKKLPITTAPFCSDRTHMKQFSSIAVWERKYSKLGWSKSQDWIIQMMTFLFENFKKKITNVIKMKHKWKTKINSWMSCWKMLFMNSKLVFLCASHRIASHMMFVCWSRLMQTQHTAFWM